MRVWTTARFGVALTKVLARQPVRTVAERTVELERDSRAALPPEAPPEELLLESVSKTAVDDYMHGRRVPGERALRTLLAVAYVRSETEQQAWFAARRRVLSPRRPAGAVRVQDANPRLLGVHKAIAADPADRSAGGGDAAHAGFLPACVERDLDTAPDGLRARIAEAAERGGFVLLVGGSSVGKTRSAYEAVRELLSDWWLVHSSRPTDPVEIRDLVAAPAPHTVVWLDELQRYLGPGGLTAGDVRALLSADEPVVLVGTLWPRRYEDYRRRPRHGQPDPYFDARELLQLADVLTVEAAFSGGAGPGCRGGEGRRKAGPGPRRRRIQPAAGAGRGSGDGAAMADRTDRSLPARRAHRSRRCHPCRRHCAPQRRAASSSGRRLLQPPRTNPGTGQLV